jgi:hypothetical protein
MRSVTDADSGTEVHVVRDKTVRDFPFAYTLWIDDKAVGEISNGETQRYSVTSGPHSIRIGIAGRWLGHGKFWTSPTRNVELDAGQTAMMRCRPTPLTAVFDLVRPTRRLQLHSEPSPQE